MNSTLSPSRGLAALFACWIGLACATPAAAQIGLIYDTDIGNDVDDVLALGVIHALQSRGECRLLAVTITKDHELAAPLVDAINTFYGRGDVPIGVCRSGITPDEGRFLGLARAADGGKLRFPHDLVSGKQAPPAVQVLRQALAAAADGSVAIAQVGFSTNLVALLDSPADAISPLAGPELVRAKVKLLSVMAGEFTRPDYGEYNVHNDRPAAQRLAAQWPTAVVWSGFEIGLAVPTPHQSIERDYAYAAHHPVAEAYVLYEPPPHDRPTWDLTAVLYAVRPDRGYFDLSSAGTVTVSDASVTTFQAGAGQHRHLVLTEAQKPRVTEALMLLASEPPRAR
jgi:inosine-uridine nucleoside N-ribohydrolase